MPWYIYTMEYYLAVKKKGGGNFTFCNGMGGLGDYYAN